MIIEKYSFGSMTISGTTYTQDLIILSDKIVGNWWRKQGHSLEPSDLKEIFQKKPKFLIVGTGFSGAMQIPESTKKELSNLSIELIALPTQEAYKIFNQYRGKDLSVVGAFHLTC